MPRVSAETLGKLKSFLDSLPVEARGKCAICNETLTHIVKQAEAKTGAGTATVTKALANEINANAAPQDRVTPGALKQKVMRHEGVIGTNRTDNPAEPLTWTCSDCKGTFPLDQEECDCGKGADPEQHNQASTRHTIVDGKVYQGIRYAEMAIAQLERIEKDDPQREEALRKVLSWVQQHLGVDGAIDQEAPLPPAKAKRRDKALDVLKPLAERAIMVAIEAGLDKTLHLNDSFETAYSTRAGAGRVLVAQVVVKKVTGT